MNKVYEQETMRLGLSCKEFYLRQYKQELLRFLGNINYPLFGLVEYNVLGSNLNLRILLYALALSFNANFINFQLNSPELTVAITVLIEDLETLKARFFLCIEDDKSSISDTFRQYFGQVLALVDVQALNNPVTEDENELKLISLSKTLYYWLEGYTTYERLKLETHRMSVALDKLKAQVNEVLTEWPKKKKFVERVYKLFWYERLVDKKNEIINYFNAYKENIEIYREKQKIFNNENKSIETNDIAVSRIMICDNEKSINDASKIDFINKINCNSDIGNSDLSLNINQANESLNTKCNIEMLEKLHSDLDIIDKELREFKLEEQEETKDYVEDYIHKFTNFERLLNEDKTKKTYEYVNDYKYCIIRNINSIYENKTNEKSENETNVVEKMLDTWEYNN
eukprot:Mrub_03892.p1 GENE.Mrub_03892~~Mrub_03892.p1  ORF type:complete len:446 (-),score=59.73 Mrub_03892:30-1226(-)